MTVTIFLPATEVTSVAAVKAWRAGKGVLPHGGAGQLVIEDRAERSGLGDR